DRQFPLTASENGKDRPQVVRLIRGGIVHSAQLWRLVPVTAPSNGDGLPPGGEPGERGEPFPDPPPVGKEKNTTHASSPGDRSPDPGAEPAPLPQSARGKKISSAYVKGTENVPQ